MEQEAPRATITECFSDLEDPRRQNRRHKLLDILVIAICAAISGADGWEDVELFGVAKGDDGDTSVLHLESQERCQATAACRTQPLGHREQGTLGLGYHLP